MKIKLNGKILECTSKTVFDLMLEERMEISKTIVIFNGFQTNENMALQENDEICLIPRGEMPEKDALEEMMMSRHTPGVHACVKEAYVGIAGLGGLGSHIAIALARTGIGHLHLVDFDLVEPSNLNRQMYFISHLGRKKTDALAELIHQINPYISVTTDCIRVTEENAMDIFAEDEIVCEAFDQPQAKAMLIDSLLSNRKDVIVVAASGMAGYADSNQIQTRKVGSRLYVCGDGVSEARPGNGLMAPRVSICAGHQANQVLQILVERKEEMKWKIN